MPLPPAPPPSGPKARVPEPLPAASAPIPAHRVVLTNTGEPSGVATQTGVKARIPEPLPEPVAPVAAHRVVLKNQGTALWNRSTRVSALAFVVLAFGGCPVIRAPSDESPNELDDTTSIPTESDPDPHTDTGAESDVDASSDTESSPDTEPAPETDTIAESDTEADTAPDTETDTDAEPDVSFGGYPAQGAFPSAGLSGVVDVTSWPPLIGKCGPVWPLEMVGTTWEWWLTIETTPGYPLEGVRVEPLERMEVIRVEQRPLSTRVWVSFTRSLSLWGPTEGEYIFECGPDGVYSVRPFISETDPTVTTEVWNPIFGYPGYEEFDVVNPDWTMDGATPTTTYCPLWATDCRGFPEGHVMNQLEGFDSPYWRWTLLAPSHPGVGWTCWQWRHHEPSVDGYYPWANSSSASLDWFGCCTFPAYKRYCDYGSVLSVIPGIGLVQLASPTTYPMTLARFCRPDIGCIP